MLASKTLASSTLETSTTLASQPTASKALLSPSLTIDPGTMFQNRASGNGLQADYFSDRDLKSLKLSRVDATVNFNWGKGAPATNLGSDNFSVRWTGQIAAKYSETYTFYTKADNGVRLWVNGQLIVNNWADHTVKEDRGTIRLEAGQKYDLKLEYYEKGGKAVSKLLWSSASQTKQIIPQSQLFSSNQLEPPAPPLSQPRPGEQPVPPLSQPRPNEKPSVTVPGSQSTSQNLSLPLAGIRVQDPDAASSNITVTLSAGQGILTVANVPGGVTLNSITNNGTRSVILVGTLMQINALLLAPSGVTYRPDASFTGIDRIQVAVNDNGNTGSGGPLSALQTFTVDVSRSTAGGNTALIGTNLNGVTDYTTEWPFVDAFKVARPWISQRTGAAYGAGGKLNLTADGWVASLEPGQSAETVIFDNGSHYPAGQYTLLYEGQGSFEFGFDSAKIVSQTPGRMVLNITPQDTGIWLKITAVNASDPLRNLRLIMPGFEKTYEQQPFHPLFLERLSKFQTLRFMDWQNTNNSDLKEWADRPLTSSPTQSNLRGVAVEYMINLANKLHIDPWFSIPHQASDDYVRQFATLVRDRLDPSLKAHIEYSNEVWNPQFEQAGYARDQGKALGLSDNDFIAQLRYYSQRSVEIFNIWEGVFGGTNRLVRVMASQGVNTFTGEQVLSWKDAYKETDEYAIAPYFYGDGLLDPANVNATLQKTPDQIIDGFLNEIHTETRRVDTENATLASRFGVALAAYEGGPHLYSYQFGAQTDQVTELFNSVNRNPRMRDVYKEYLNEWKQAGGGNFNQFTDVSIYSQYGQWGALEYQDQDISMAPKYLGLMDFIAANSR